MKTRHRNKSLSPPKIDDRDFAAILSEIKQLVSFYTPEWQVTGDIDSGSALLNIFSRMVAGTIEQLNRVPEKNFIAFLNLLGVKLLPAQPARVPVSFSLSEGTKENVLVPAKTKISAERNTIKNEPVVFETEKSISVTPASLVAAYSVNPETDSIFSAPSGFLTGKQTPVETKLLEDAKSNDINIFIEDISDIEAGDILKISDLINHEHLEVNRVQDKQINLQDRLTNNYSIDNTVVEKVVNFELFTGKDRQEHSFYLGHSSLFNLTADARLTFDIQPENSLSQLADTNLVSWQYWGKNSAEQVYQWHSFDRVEIADNSLVLEKNSDLQTQLTKINNIDSFWIRCTIINRVSESDSRSIDNLLDIQIDSIQVTVDSSEEETTASPLDYCFAYNNLQYENKTGVPFKPFQLLEDRYKAIYLGFDAPLSKGSIGLFFSLVMDVNKEENNRPHLLWQYYRKQEAKREWGKINLRDETNSLAESGMIELIGSADSARTSLFDQSLYWIRIVYTKEQSDSLPNPICKGIYLNTTWASQIETIEREIIGSSDGKADQTFTLYRYPLLSEEVWVNEFTALTVKDREQLLARLNRLQIEEVKDKLGNATQFWVKWQPVADLLDSNTSDCVASRRHRHYEIDRFLGKITFGDGENGMIPPMGVNNIRVTYRIGGGKQGNLDRGQINRLNSSIAYIDRVSNPEPAKGGVDSELLEEALERGSQFLKHGDRAVTASDFERLSQQADRSVVKVKCLSNFNNQGKPEMGWVSIIIVPNSEEAKPLPSLQLKQRVKTYLQQRTTNLVTVPKKLDVRSPTYIEIAIKTKIIAIAFELIPEIELIAKQRLEAFLHPLTGGVRGRDWEFGRSPCISDFYALLGSIPGIDRVDSLSIASANNREIIVPPYGLIASGEHQIEVIAL